MPTIADPSSFAGAADTIAALALLVEFMMLRTALLRAQVRLYAAQSLLVAVLAGLVAASRGVPDLYALAGATVVLKVALVPGVLLWLLRRSRTQIAGSGALGVTSSVLVAILVAGFGFFAAGGLHLSSPVLPATALGVAVAMVLVSFVLMIIRRDVVSQAVGFFAMENGISIASLVIAARLPLVMEVVLLFDLLVAAIAFGLIMRTHHRQSQSLSTAALDRLRG